MVRHKGEQSSEGVDGNVKVEEGEEGEGKGDIKARGKRKPPAIDFDAPVSVGGISAFFCPPGNCAETAVAVLPSRSADTICTGSRQHCARFLSRFGVSIENRRIKQKHVFHRSVSEAHPALGPCETTVSVGCGGLKSVPTIRAKQYRHVETSIA